MKYLCLNCAETLMEQMPEAGFVAADTPFD